MLAVVGAARLISLLKPRTIVAILRVLGRGTEGASIEAVQFARDEVCATSDRCAGHGCVQRSIAVYLLCRISGSTPDWCTGFLNRPFMAHAWVEVGGVRVGEPAELLDFTTILAVRPHSLGER